MDAILTVLSFIMEKIKEKPDPNAKTGIDFDNKQVADREKQVIVFSLYFSSVFRSSILWICLNLGFWYFVFVIIYFIFNFFLNPMIFDQIVVSLFLNFWRFYFALWLLIFHWNYYLKFFSVKVYNIPIVYTNNECI